MTSVSAARFAAACLSVLILVCMGAAGSARAQAFIIAGTGSAMGTMRLVVEAFHKTGTDTRISIPPATGSSGGIRAVLAGAAGLAATARPLTEEERGRGAVQIEYGRTPFAFATRADNPVDNISLAELVDFYSAKRSAWPDRVPVRIVLRPTTDTDTSIIKNLSPMLRDAITLAERRPVMVFADTDTEAADAIEKLPGSLGPTALALVLSERRKVKMLKLDGVEPSIQALTEGRYPLFKRFYIVSGPKPAAGTKAFIAFLQSNAGQAILMQTGHVLPGPR